MAAAQNIKTGMDVLFPEKSKDSPLSEDEFRGLVQFELNKAKLGYDYTGRTHQILGWAKRIKSTPIFGEWQLCPKCHGNGWVYPQGASTAATLPCDICSGAKMIQRPVIDDIIKSEKP